MTLEQIKTKTIKVNIFGKERNFRLGMRSVALLKERCGISENELLNGLNENDIKTICCYIWAATLEFETPFDPMNPFKIKSEVSLEAIFDMSNLELQQLTNSINAATGINKAAEDFLPKEPQSGGDTKKPQKAAQTKTKKKSSK